MDEGRQSLRPSISGPFCGQIWLSIRPIHNLFFAHNPFVRIRRLQNCDFIHKKALRDWISYRLWIEGYKMPALSRSMEEHLMRERWAITSSKNWSDTKETTPVGITVWDVGNTPVPFVKDFLSQLPESAKGSTGRTKVDKWLRCPTHSKESSLGKTSLSLQPSRVFLVHLLQTPSCPLLCELPICHLLCFHCCMLSFMWFQWHPLLFLVKPLTSISDYTRCISCLLSYGKLKGIM